ncbi:hypothetical protein [Acidisphaera sp. L21]|nr:hypothetical protein [Acidisphaera sp. L21]
MTGELEALKAIPPKVVEEAYSDGVADTLKEASNAEQPRLSHFESVV